MTDLRKKAIFLIVFLLLTGLIIAVMPAIETWLQVLVLPRFGMSFEEGGAWVLTAESSRQAMNATYANAIDTAFRILKIILWMAIVIAVVRFVTYLILRTALRRSPETETSSILKTVSSIIIYIIAFFLVFQAQYPGVSLAPLFTGSTILGIVVGLALQDTLGNLFAGLALQADQPFQVGDVVNIPNRGTGVVEAISWRGVKIRTFQSKLLIISNSVLGKELIEVAPKNNLNARIVFFNTEYTFSPTRTIQLVREAVRQVENVTPKMRPVVRIRNFGPDGLEWEVKYWLEDYAKHNDTDADVRQRIWYLFRREAIDFAFPTRTVHIVPTSEPVPQDEIVNEYVEHLNRLPIFAPLSDEETEQLANASSVRVYAPGEAIVRKGQEGNSMFVILRGAVRVQIPEAGYQKTVNRLGVNDYFGEMSLLTGEPRSATVIADVETKVLRIRKEALQPIFENNPDLVQTICELIEERRALLNSEAEAAAEEEMMTSQRGVLKSIRKFFGLKGR